MSSVHIGIGHNDDFVITKLCYIKIISIPFRKSAAKRIYHCLYFSVCQYLINTCLFNIQNLASNRHDCLKHTVSCHLCRASGRISLDYENLALRSIPALTVCKLSV